jgi:nitroimidazol reductase NimA-like FMN-containing flavoprotein (pyridoxamine 5'-phosphate oxidase superfamily)
MTLDRNGLEVLGRLQCLDLLRSATIGRVLVTVGALPAAFPVSYALMGDDVVLRTGAGTKLHTASANAIVGFEVDEFDARRRTGWSVMVTGHACEIDDPAELSAAAALGLVSWVRNASVHFVRISTQLVSGRRIPEETAAFSARETRAHLAEAVRLEAAQRTTLSASTVGS